MHRLNLSLARSGRNRNPERFPAPKHIIKRLIRLWRRQHVFSMASAMNIENATTAALLIAAVTLFCAIIYFATGTNL